VVALPVTVPKVLGSDAEQEYAEVNIFKYQ